MLILELSDSGKITITIDSCKLFMIYHTIMIVINNINYAINACTFVFTCYIHNSLLFQQLITHDHGMIEYCQSHGSIFFMTLQKNQHND